MKAQDHFGIIVHDKRDTHLLVRSEKVIGCIYMQVFVGTLGQQAYGPLLPPVGFVRKLEQPGILIPGVQRSHDAVAPESCSGNSTDGPMGVAGGSECLFHLVHFLLLQLVGVAPDAQKGVGGRTIAPYNNGPFLVALLTEPKEAERPAQRHTTPEVLNGSDDPSLQGWVGLRLPDHREYILSKQDPGPCQTPKYLALFPGGFLKSQVVGAVFKENAALLADVGVIIDTTPGSYRTVGDLSAELTGQQVLLADQVEHDHRRVVLFLFHHKNGFEKGA